MRIIQINIKKAIFVYLIIYILCFSLGAAYKKSHSDSTIYESNLEIGDKLGFDLNKTAITFGEIVPGSSVSRSVVLQATNNDRRVRVYSKGNISDFLVIPENDFVVKSGETKEINFRAKIPLNETPGKYSGKIKIKTAKNQLF